VLSGGIDRRDAMQALMKKSSGRVRFSMFFVVLARGFWWWES